MPILDLLAALHRRQRIAIPGSPRCRWRDSTIASGPDTELATRSAPGRMTKAPIWNLVAFPSPDLVFAKFWQADRLGYLSMVRCAAESLRWHAEGAVELTRHVLEGDEAREFDDGIDIEMAFQTLYDDVLDLPS